MKRKTKKLLLIVIILAIISIGVGYAALAQNLIANGTTNTKEATEWDVEIANIEESTKTSGTTDATCSVNEDKVSASFSATLIPNGSITYKVTTINNGSIAAKVGTPIISYGEGGDSEYINCTVTPNSSNSSSISNGEKHTYTVTMSYAKENLPETAVTENVIVTFPYSQAE